MGETRVLGCRPRRSRDHDPRLWLAGVDPGQHRRDPGTGPGECRAGHRLHPHLVEKFMTQPDATVKLTEFQKTSTWRQQEFVEKGGWATLPGSKEPNAKVAGACAGQLTQTNKT